MQTTVFSFGLNYFREFVVLNFSVLYCDILNIMQISFALFDINWAIILE